MSEVKPADLTGVQWLLLRQLNKYGAPFYTEDLYVQFLKHEMDRPSFYLMFFTLATLNYIQLSGYGEIVPGWKQDFCYVLTQKGKRVINQYTQAAEPLSIPFKSKKRVRIRFIASHSTTLRLRDYSLNP